MTMGMCDSPRLWVAYGTRRVSLVLTAAALEATAATTEAEALTAAVLEAAAATTEAEALTQRIAQNI